ncbi:efflux RND transporter periplasmic adaptor subunit [Thalassotalea sp. Y01]|uniref:efflux RND transporter periplasmic adaptor subunit n=1 Tax=Thalassotalea sp. Y01 TaxID=2729613 RepID=UPI00145D2383|nr:efflux RND transporter periplasmic adaptor subunit [Thalassotalea sp. Y01]NMP17949.1 efflux RND transporter periplasmic adaptor subunit [Thalassotalea sp. Y01]
MSLLTIFRQPLSWLLFSALAAFNSYAETVKVDVIYAKSNDNQSQLTLSGTVEAKQNANLASLQSGLIATLFVEVGDKVDKGQRLLTLDAKLAALNLAQAQADIDAANVEMQEAQRLYNEVVTLSKQQLVAETQLQERKAAVATTKAKVTRLQAERDLQQEILNRHTLYAPFAGVIAKRHVDVGEWVTQQSPIFTLIEQNNLRVNLAIPQEYYGQLADNHRVAVTIIPDFEGAPAIDATLDRLVAVSNNTSRTLTAYVNLSNDTPLLAGMSATVKVHLPSQLEPIVWLPKSAVKQHPDGGFSIFSVVEQKAKRYLVKVVKQQDNQVAVTGAPSGQAFIVSGIELLKDGDVLQVNKVQDTPL